MSIAHFNAYLHGNGSGVLKYCSGARTRISWFTGSLRGAICNPPNAFRTWRNLPHPTGRSGRPATTFRNIMGDSLPAISGGAVPNYLRIGHREVDEIAIPVGAGRVIHGGFFCTIMDSCQCPHPDKYRALVGVRWRRGYRPFGRPQMYGV